MSGASPRSETPRVLVIDDEEHIRGLLSELLMTWGCQADVAANGREGLSLFEPGRYDLVLTDLLMPGVTGLEVVKTVRDADASVGVIMLTASTADLESDRRRLGFTLLQKPVPLDVLERAVKRALAEGAPAPA